MGRGFRDSRNYRRRLIWLGLVGGAPGGRASPIHSFETAKNLASALLAASSSYSWTTALKATLGQQLSKRALDVSLQEKAAPQRHRSDASLRKMSEQLDKLRAAIAAAEARAPNPPPPNILQRTPKPDLDALRAKIARAEGDGGGRLREAARLLRGDVLAQKSGLCQTLEALADRARNPPDDTTNWLCAKLRELRPKESRIYERPVLQGLVMKCDEFAHIHLFDTPRIHPAVWNFRKCDLDLSVYGVGQCHAAGINHVISELQKDHSSIVWCNMREEPVVFLDGQACAPRTANNLNENVEYLQSIEDFELDAMERRLCRDCVEAGRTLPVYYQVSGTENEKRNLSTSTARCVSDVYPSSVRYHRIPIADEAAPEEKDFDQLISAIRSAPSDSAFVFNCQMGRGRTTTGMVCACIMMRASSGKLAAPAVPREGTDPRIVGDFRCVRELVAMLDRGREAKALADACCKACAHAQHLVEAIMACDLSAKVAPASSHRNPDFWRARGRNYLERYCYLVLFAAYALEHASSGFAASFSEWAHHRWQLKRVLKHMTLEG